MQEREQLLTLELGKFMIDAQFCDLQYYLLATATAADPIDGWIVGSLFGSVALYSGL